MELDGQPEGAPVEDPTAVNHARAFAGREVSAATQTVAAVLADPGVDFELRHLTTSSSVVLLHEDVAQPWDFEVSAMNLAALVKALRADGSAAKVLERVSPQTRGVLEMPHGQRWHPGAIAVETWGAIIDTSGAPKLEALMAEWEAIERELAAG